MSERERLTKKRWWILAASCFINLCIGSLYGWSVFATPMARYLNSQGGGDLTAAGLSVVFMVANSVGPITLISGGFVNDRLGPKWVIFTGGLLFGGGMLLSGFAKGIPGLILGYGLGCGFGMGLVYGCTVSNSVKFFPDKRGLIGGIATASYGISSVLIPPIAGKLIQSIGVLGAFRVLGLTFAVIVCACAMLIEKCPADFVPVGMEEKGGRTADERDLNATKGAVSTDVFADKNWKEMLRDPACYVMILMLTSGATFGLMTISQASPIAQRMIGLSVEAATIAVSVLALFNAAGRVAAGYISDKIGRINTLTLMLILGIFGLLLLLGAKYGSVLRFYIGISVVGICFGAFMGVFPGFTADRFGQKNNSVNYGIMFIGFALGGYLGPALISDVHSRTGNYQPAFFLAIMLAVFGLILSVVYRILDKRRVTA